MLPAPLPRPSVLSEDPLLLLTRAACSLCEEFERELARLAARLPLPAIRTLDVDADPELARRYGLDVPVLLWGSVKVCQHRLDPAELTRLLRPR